MHTMRWRSGRARVADRVRCGSGCAVVAPGAASWNHRLLSSHVPELEFLVVKAAGAHERARERARCPVRAVAESLAASSPRRHDHGSRVQVDTKNNVSAKHARSEELRGIRGVPLEPPHAAACVERCERFAKRPYIPQAHALVVRAGDKVLRVCARVPDRAHACRMLRDLGHGAPGLCARIPNLQRSVIAA
eukprot:Amastigsp_a184708_4.p2 type:complete len:191 gc:universal Amastigsp_a184708_4:1161-589(-)